MENKPSRQHAKEKPTPEAILDAALGVDRGLVAGSKRNSGWHKASEAYIREVGQCEFCGAKLGEEGVELEVHHVEPFHVRPDLEMEKSNWAVLCRKPHDCHRLVGHFRNFSLWNPLLRPFLEIWKFVLRLATAMLKIGHSQPQNDDGAHG